MKSGAKIIFLTISIFGIFGWAENSWAAAIFENNFNNIATWKPIEAGPSIGCWQTTPTEGGGGACSPPYGPVPVPFNDFRQGGTGSCAVSGYDTMNIGSSEDLPLATGYSAWGGSGKAYLHWNEPCLSPSLSWGSDGLLGYWLGTTGYPELYVRFKMRFQSGWRWATSTSPMMKLGHITHYDGIAGPGMSNYFSNNLPELVPGLAKFSSGAFPLEIYLYNRNNGGYESQEAGYQICGNVVDPSTPGCPMDGQWHTFEFRVKMNSAAGVSDGIKEMWYDGVKKVSFSNVNWSGSGAPSSYQFNRVIIGGNSSNPFTGGGEQWYAMDELVASTTYIGPTYVVGAEEGGDTTAPAAPGGLSVI